MLRVTFAARSSATLFLAAVALVACFPNFEFNGGQGGDPTTTSVSRATVGPGPEGGANNVGAGPGSGGFTTTSTGGGGSVTIGTGGGGGTGPTLPTVACGPKPANDPANAPLPQCEPNQLCCFSQQSASMDHCQADDGNSATDDCGSSYYNFFCDGPSDCPGAVCCARYTDFLGIPDFDGLIECASSCAGDDRRVCKTNADCTSGTCQVVEGIDNLGATEYQHDYRECR